MKASTTERPILESWNSCPSANATAKKRARQAEDGADVGAVDDERVGGDAQRRRDGVHREIRSVPSITSSTRKMGVTKKPLAALAHQEPVVLGVAPGGDGEEAPAQAEDQGLVLLPGPRRSPPWGEKAILTAV